MITRIFIVCFIFFFSIVSNAQQSPLLWEKFYDQKGDERIKDLYVCKDGSMLFTGFTTYKGVWSKVVLHAWYGKLNASGEKIWTGYWDSSELSTGNAIISGKDGKSFIVGYFDHGDVNGSGSAIYSWIGKDGTLSDPQMSGQTGQHYDFETMTESSDGTILVAGTSGKELSMTRFSSEGVIQTTRTYWLDNAGVIHDFKEKKNGNLIIVGGIYGSDKDLLIFEVDKDLNLLWKKVVNRAHLEEIQSVCLAQDGGYIVCGSQYENSTSKKIGWYAKFDSKGEVVWEHHIDNFSKENNSIKVVEYDKGRYALARSSYGAHQDDKLSKNHDLSFIVFDESGNTLWEYTYATSKIEYFYDLAVGKDMSLLAGGELLSSDTASNGFIYSFKPTLSSPGIPVYILSKDTEKPISGATVIVKHDDGITEHLTASNTGIVMVSLKKSERCTIEVEALGYQTLNDALTLPADGVSQSNKYYLVKAKAGTSIVMKSVNFERGTTKLLPGSYEELDRLAQYMNDHPDSKIELSGHTDNGGTPKANQLLSEQRAQEVKGYLESKGIAAHRIIAKGYGGSKPIAPNDSEMNKSKNRRVEVKLL